MQTKLQELTEKIYQEGVEKAQSEADKILSEAKLQAAEIIARAQKEAENMLGEAGKESNTLRKNALNELQLAGRQLVSDIKLKIVELVEYKSLAPQTKEAFNDQVFVKELIITTLKNWKANSAETVDMEVLLPAAKQKEFESYIKDQVNAVFGKGVQISFSERIESGFKIGPKDGGYLISFTGDDFENFFQTYLRPRLVELLYGQKQ
jgi:V/A-type H+-transporting ATPase subunit E